MTGAWVYIITNRPNGTLYVGVTNDIRRRAWEHREELCEGFSMRYGLNRLVYVEQHPTMIDAIRREKAIKRWRRAWKIRVILGANPDWTDLYETIV